MNPAFRDSPARSAVQACLVLGALGCAVWGVLTLVLWSLYVPAALQTRTWVPVPGTLLQAFTPGCGGRLNPLQLSYTYTVAGTPGAGRRLAADPGYNMWLLDCGRDLTRRLQPRFSGPQSITVYVNPQRPQEAVLIRRVPSPVRPVRTLLCGALLWGAFLLLGGGRPERGARA